MYIQIDVWHNPKEQNLLRYVVVDCQIYSNLNDPLELGNEIVSTTITTL